MIYTVYVLYSVKFDKIYNGYTSDIEQRLLSHNKLATKGYTIKFRPWSILFTEQYESKPEAMKREKVLKSELGGELIWKMIKDKQS